MKQHTAIIIKNDDDEILFIKRSLKKTTLPGIWSFPSGTIEEQEKFYNTGIREAQEELDINIELEKTLAIKELPEFSVKLIFVLYSINNKDNKNNKPFIKEPDEIDEIKWMTFNDFFNTFTDKEIGHGLIWLRQNKEIWETI